MHQLQVSLHRKTLMIFDYTGVSSWWLARWSALMTCPSPPVRAISLFPTVARQSMCSMSDFKEGCQPFKNKEKSIKLLYHHCQKQHSVILICSNVLKSIKEKENKIFYYNKGTCHHINRLNTIYTQFFT